MSKSLLDEAIEFVEDKQVGYSLVRQLAAEINRLTAERDRLREALAPFVALLQPHNDQGPDRQPIFGINDATITLGMLRTARAALGDRT